MVMNSHEIILGFTKSFCHDRSHLCRYWRQPSNLPLLQVWSLPRPQVLQCPPGPRGSRGGLRHWGREGLLAGEEQLGRHLGREGLHQDGQEQEERLWYCHPGQLPRRLELVLMMSELVNIKYLHNKIIQKTISIRVKSEQAKQFLEGEICFSSKNQGLTGDFREESWK